MADTFTLPENVEVICSDCEENQASLAHCGQFVPTNTIGYFCQKCFGLRVDDYNNGRVIRSLGQKSVQLITME